MIEFELLHPQVTYEHLGLLPGFLDPDDLRPAKEQFDEHYAHGGGWHPFKGFKMLPDHSIKYPGDPVHPPLARAKLRDETIVFYQYAWVAIIQKDGSYEIARMD